MCEEHEFCLFVYCFFFNYFCMTADPADEHVRVVLAFRDMYCNENGNR